MSLRTARLNQSDLKRMLCLGRAFGLGLLALLVMAWPSSTFGQADGNARVEADVGSGTRFAGQGFELRLSVVAAGKVPKVEPPRISNAHSWVIATERDPITSTGIGSVVSGESRFVIRLRVVADRPGTLEIPSVPIQLETRTVRSRPLRVRIQPVPLEGRPAEFLGGVGPFVLKAEAVPNVIRVGQELDFRIKVDGPAAWGMTQRPELARFERLPLGFRIEPKEDETSTEPPSRTLVYRLRPTKAGEATLPAVLVAAFDPATSRFVTQAAEGVPVRVVAVPSFDPTTIDDGEFTRGAGRWDWAAWTAWGSSAFCLVVGFAALARVRRRLRHRSLVGPQAARRFAARLARRLDARDPWAAPGHPPKRGVTDGVGCAEHEAARRVCDELISYLEIGILRPPGALTPDEARTGVVQLTGSEELGKSASELTTRCDRVLYGEANGRRGDRELLQAARGLFSALGHSRIRREGMS